MNRCIEWTRTTGRTSRMTVTEDVEVPEWYHAYWCAGAVRGEMDPYFGEVLHRVNDLCALGNALREALKP
jgi:hypothetical protein